MNKRTIGSICLLLAVPVLAAGCKWIEDRLDTLKTDKKVGDLITHYTTDGSSGMCVLVKLTPWGKAEEQFMHDFSHIKETLKVRYNSVMLNELFGYKNSAGLPVVVYTLEFDTDKEADDAVTWLNEYFFKMITSDSAFNDDADPEVVYSRKIVTDDI